MRTETIGVHYKLTGDKKGQDATIFFVDGKFTKCEYHVSNLSYTIEDWKWLGDISNRIQEFAEIEAKRFRKIRNLED